MTPDDVLVARDAAGIVTITLNRPARRNAMLPTMWGQLTDALRSVDADESARLVVMRGAGTDFCSGADVKKPLGGTGPDDLSYEELLAAVKECVVFLHDLRVPTVAAVDGAAIGGGFNLALACDFIIATERARFSQVFVHRGLAVDTGGSWLLPRAVGLARAKRLVLSGATIGADEALQMGFVAEVVGNEPLDMAIARFAAELLRGDANALTASKRLLHAGAGSDLAPALDAESTTQLDLVAQPQFMAAMVSFVRDRQSKRAERAGAAQLDPK